MDSGNPIQLLVDDKDAKLQRLQHKLEEARENCYLALHQADKLSKAEEDATFYKRCYVETKVEANQFRQNHGACQYVLETAQRELKQAKADRDRYKQERDKCRANKIQK